MPENTKEKNVTGTRIRKTNPRLFQGDVISDVKYVELLFNLEGLLEVKEINLPNIIIVSQDCDLQQDLNNRNSTKHDKNLLSVLILPLYNSVAFFKGEHLLDYEMKMTIYNGSDIDRIKSNQNKRYHFINFERNIKIPDSVIDFKHLFTVNRSYLEQIKKDNYVCSLCSLFQQDISQRFCSYLSRAALPISIESCKEDE